MFFNPVVWANVHYVVGVVPEAAGSCAAFAAFAAFAAGAAGITFAGRSRSALQVARCLFGGLPVSAGSSSLDSCGFGSKQASRMAW